MRSMYCKALLCYGGRLRSTILVDMVTKFSLILSQVIEGGDLDVNFVVSDPDKKPLVMEPHSMDGLHAIDIKKTGEYEICLDNSFSRLTGGYSSH